MAIINNTIKIESTDLTTDAISLTSLSTITGTVGGVSRVKIVGIAIGSKDLLIDEDQYTQGAKIWLYNPSSATTGEKIYITLDGVSEQVVLSGGDWALIPWSAAGSSTPVDVSAYAETTLNVLEFGVFN